MGNKSVQWYIFMLLFAIGWHSAIAQDSIPSIAPMASVTDTIVIRTPQEPVDIVPRGVSLANPTITFYQTKPLNKRQKRFRVPSFWEKLNELDFQLSEVAFVNWNAGGENAVSALGKLYFERNYKFRFFKWNNNLEMRFGWNAQEGRKWRKTDDAIRLSSTLDYQRDTISSWYYSAKANFNTQFANGYKYPDRTTPISRFMAPGYLFMGGGTSYMPEGKDFKLYLSPITFKSTFVLDQDLANQGAFGVQEAIRDAEGNIITPGKKVYRELGFLITHSWKFPVAKNVVLDHKLGLYTDYLNNFGNIDVDWQLTTTFTVNEFISATLLLHFIYDDDIKFDRVEDENGLLIDPGVPKLQFRQQLGIGINYKF